MPQSVSDEREHRRGLVLGLTLAEVLLLLLFLLLLVLGARLTQLQNDTRAALTERDQLRTAMEGLEPLRAELTSKGGLDFGTVKEIVEKIARVEELQKRVADLLRERSDLSAQVAAMMTIGDASRFAAFSEAIQVAAKIDPNDPPAFLRRAIAVIEKLGKDTNPEQVKPLSELIADAQSSERLTAAELRISATEGERDRMRRERDNLMHRGNGLTYPSCWTADDGRTQYIFDVTILDTGVIVRDAGPESRRNDEAWKFVDAFSRNIEIKESIFYNATQRIFNRSIEQKCRFYAIIRDGTGPTSKTRYKQLRTLVESHFYPLLRNERWAPTNRPPAQEPIVVQNSPVRAGAPSPASSQPVTRPMPIGGPFIPVLPRRQ